MVSSTEAVACANGSSPTPDGKNMGTNQSFWRWLTDGADWGATDSETGIFLYWTYLLAQHQRDWDKMMRISRLSLHLNKFKIAWAVEEPVSKQRKIIPHKKYLLDSITKFFDL